MLRLKNNYSKCDEVQISFLLTVSAVSFLCAQSWRTNYFETPIS